MSPEQEQAERVRVTELMDALLPNGTLVFDSNLAGVHAAKMAQYARRYYGAVVGVPEGLRGNSYAIPTRDESLNRLELADITFYVRRFIVFARSVGVLQFVVPGTFGDLAGWTEEQMAPMFAGSPENVHLPDGWRNLVEKGVR